jgi:hypothetical protein
MEKPKRKKTGKQYRSEKKENSTDRNDGAEGYLLLVAPPPPLVYILKERVWIWER